MTPVFHHRIETALPLRSEGSSIEISGWCLLEGTSVPPAVKLMCDRGEIQTVRRISRPDVTAAFAPSTAEDLWGFQFQGKLPPGAHLLTLRAAESDRTDGHVLQVFTVTVLSQGLQAAIEFPSEGPIRTSERIQGWCAHPEESLREVSLHYGTRRVPCQFGLPRSDVAKFVPTSPDAPASGFITVKNAFAGRGRLRVVTLDGKGARHIATTDRMIDINADEENPGGLNLPEKTARLSEARRVAISSAAEEIVVLEHPLKVLFVLYGDLTSNSALHVAALADAMIQLGHECIVAVFDHPETIANHRGARFRAVAFDAVPHDGKIFREGRPPDIIHAWTTRENVRHFCEPLRAASGAKLVVHLEDHELRILEINLGRSLGELLELAEKELDRLVPATLSHPRYSRQFLESADGVSVIADKLRELVPAGPAVHRFWPAAASAAFFRRPIPTALREALGFAACHTLLFYHGNVHAANQGEVRQLYLAVAKLNAEGHPTTLLRTGRDFCDFLGSDAGACGRYVLPLGMIEQHHHLAPLMALADFFVQPGEADTFNEYRFPSKLPEFFAIGRPVILPLTNLGRVVRHGEDAYVLAKADAAGIAEAIRAIHADPVLRERLGAGAVAFAEKAFNWRRNAEGLLDFYAELRRSAATHRSPFHARHSGSST